MKSSINITEKKGLYNFINSKQKEHIERRHCFNQSRSSVMSVYGKNQKLDDQKIESSINLSVDKFSRRNSLRKDASQYTISPKKVIKNMANKFKDQSNVSQINTPPVFHVQKSIEQIVENKCQKIRNHTTLKKNTTSALGDRLTSYFNNNEKSAVNSKSVAYSRDVSPNK